MTTSFSSDMKIQRADPQSIVKLIHSFQRTFVISRAIGEPADGKLAFSPLNFHIIILLNTHGSLRPTQICTELGCPKTTLSTALLTLEKKGLIARQSDPDDGRAQLVSLTPKGRLVNEGIESYEAKITELLLSELGTDADVVLKACERLRGALSEIVRKAAD